MNAPRTPARAGLAGGGFGVYSRAVRRHWLAVVLITVAATAASVAWLAVRSPKYEATTQVLVTPLSPDDQTFFGLQLLRDSGDDPSRVLKTAATILRSPQAARRAAEMMGPEWGVKRIMDAVEIEPQAQSSILEITGTADDPREAARLSNRFTQASLEVRAESLRSQVRATLDRLRARQQDLELAGVESADLSARINQLEAIRQGDDPTLSLTQAASRPTSQAGAAPAVVVALSIVVGLALGIAAALLLEIMNRRVRDEDEATELYPLPVLARVPILPRSAMAQSLNGSVWRLPPQVHEAFRTVLVQLTGHPDGSPQALMVTSASTGDGKTTSAINLAVSVAAAGRSAILMDWDIRKPDVSRMLGIKGHSLASLVTTDPSGDGFDELVVNVPGVPNLSALATSSATEGDLGLVELLHHRLPTLLAEARRRADVVVLDSAPLGEVSDALRIVEQIDQILIVARPGHTNRMNFEVMRDLLERSAHAPAAMLMIGQTEGLSGRYYQHAVAARRRGPVSRRLARLRR